MKKRWMIFTAAFLLTAFSLRARAEDYAGGEDWQVTFTGKKLESSFDYEEVADLARGMQPGDRMTMEISLKNSGGRSADWYLSNEVLQTFEETDGTGAAGGAYTYVLTYTDKAGKKELYSSSRVGGEKTGGGNSSAGLHEAVDGLEEYMYLGRLENGGTGSLRLEVVLDGETQGNGYARTLASLKLNFAVENVPESVGPDREADRETPEEASVTPVKEVIRRTVTKYTSEDVRTGDYSRTLFWTLSALGSGILLFLCGAAKLRRDKGGGGDEK